MFHVGATKTKKYFFVSIQTFVVDRINLQVPTLICRYPTSENKKTNNQTDKAQQNTDINKFQNRVIIFILVKNYKNIQMNWLFFRECETDCWIEKNIAMDGNKFQGNRSHEDVAKNDDKYLFIDGCSYHIAIILLLKEVAYFWQPAMKPCGRRACWQTRNLSCFLHTSHNYFNPNWSNDAQQAPTHSKHLYTHHSHTVLSHTASAYAHAQTHRKLPTENFHAQPTFTHKTRTRNKLSHRARF